MFGVKRTCEAEKIETNKRSRVDEVDSDVDLVSLVSELHNYSIRSASSNQVAIPLFRTNLRRFCPSIIGSFFWNDILQSIRDKPSKKMFRKALLRWYLAQY